MELVISIHALLAESDILLSVSILINTHFYPRSPCGERRYECVPCYNSVDISIHALLAESDFRYSTVTRSPVSFLSTLSLRRATAVHCECVPVASYFYPRSPCGERRTYRLCADKVVCISIHALLAESDIINNVINVINKIFLSTLSLRRATGKGPR